MPNVASALMLSPSAVLMEWGSLPILPRSVQISSLLLLLFHPVLLESCFYMTAFFVFFFLQISFWLLENGFSVLIAACDTFRAGAVEQLRTHTRRLTALHPPEKHGGRTMVQLFEKGYGKDAAGIAMEAIAFGSVGTKRAYGVIFVFPRNLQT